MAESKAAFKSLNVTDRVRINAVIMSAFETDPNNFIANFREQVKANSTGKNRNAGYQIALDNLREYLASDIKNVPDAKKNGVDDRADLGTQEEVFRNLQGTMAYEKRNATYSSAQIIAEVKKLKEFAASNYQKPLPEPVLPYGGRNEMLAHSAALAACKGMTAVGSCEANVALNAPRNQPTETSIRR